MFSLIRQGIKGYEKSSFLAPLLMVIEVICEVLLPFLMGNIIDKGIRINDLNNIILYGGLMLLCAGTALLAGTFSGKMAALASSGLAKNLRFNIFKQIQKFGFENIDHFSTSSLITRLTSDINNVQQTYQMILRMCVRAPLMLVFAISLTIYIGKQLSLVFVVALFILGISLFIMIKLAYPLFMEVFRRYDDLNKVVQENINNMRVVKAYVKEYKEKDKFHKASFSVYELFLKAEYILLYNGPVMTFCMNFSLIALAYFGAQLITQGQLTTGQLMSMFTYTMSVLMSLMMISMIFVQLSMSMASISRIKEVLKEEINLKNCDNPLSKIEDNSIIMKNVNFTYADGTLALENINFNINPNETIGIIGGTGSGKTTLVSLISRLYDVTSGEILVGNVNVKDLDLKYLRQQVAMVLQKNVLFSGSVWDNLKVGDSKAIPEECIKICKIVQADTFINQLENGYDTIITAGGTNVSGGQRQRLCLARALLKKPQILILDDTTSAIDTKTEQMIMNALNQEITNMTKIIISQRITSIMNANRIIVLDDGKIVAIGSHNELLEDCAIYQDIYNTQKRGDDNDGE
ncbi:MAG: ABC transporter ATP-binding protein [Erysipelotrichaceae bacterium]